MGGRKKERNKRQKKKRKEKKKKGKKSISLEGERGKRTFNSGRSDRVKVEKKSVASGNGRENEAKRQVEKKGI